MYLLTIIHSGIIQEYYLFHKADNATRKYIGLLKGLHPRFCRTRKVNAPDYYVRNPLELAALIENYMDFEAASNIEIHYTETTPQDLSDFENQRPDYVEADNKDLHIQAEQVVFKSVVAIETLHQFPDLLAHYDHEKQTMAIQPGTGNKWFIWAISHNLSFHSDVPFIIKSKNDAL